MKRLYLELKDYLNIESSVLALAHKAKLVHTDKALRELVRALYDKSEVYINRDCTDLSNIQSIIVAVDTVDVQTLEVRKRIICMLGAKPHSLLRFAIRSGYDISIDTQDTMLKILQICSRHRYTIKEVTVRRR